MMVIGTPGSLRSPLVATWPIAALLYGNSVLETLPCCEHYPHYQELIEPSGASVPKLTALIYARHVIPICLASISRAVAK